ncbi:MAG TPA: hypothetical protein VK753_07925 [Xanthomonadaceae bacterium]|nr:hypothetical protein [Xanthomonadaceae bacterium]
MKTSSLNLRPRSLAMLAAPMAAAIMMALPASSFAGVDVSINIAPPEIPVYEQPPIPGDGYLWTPGYWAYGEGDYFWVPGTWVRPPSVGLLWTPGYWAYDGGIYAFRTGYWGPHIGFYGGVNYGYGYGGRGYEGGYWNHGAFFYNRNVNAMGSIRVRNVYERPVANITADRVSFNGGPGGLNVSINVDEQRAAHERHVQPIADQQRQVEMASKNKDLRDSVNHGAPAIAATPKAGVFEGPGVVKAGASNGAGPDAAKSREDAQAKAGASAASDRDAAKSREDAQAKAGASAASDRDEAKSREDAQMKANASAASDRDNAKTREDAQKGDAAANATAPKQHHSKKPRSANGAMSDNGGAAAMPSDRTGAQGDAGRPNETPKPQRAARPERASRPADQGQPHAMKPEHPAEAPKNEEKSRKDDDKKQQ